MASTVGTILDLFRTAHQQIRDDLRDIDPAALNWVPGSDTSSIAILVAHMLGSESETLRVVKALPSDRIRDTEVASADANDVREMILVDERDSRLGAAVARDGPDEPGNEQGVEDEQGQEERRPPEDE